MNTYNFFNAHKALNLYTSKLSDADFRQLIKDGKVDDAINSMRRVGYIENWEEEFTELMKSSIPYLDKIDAILKSDDCSEDKIMALESLFDLLRWERKTISCLIDNSIREILYDEPELRQKSEYEEYLSPVVPFDFEDTRWNRE